jgi:hypothetical protein
MVAKTAAMAAVPISSFAAAPAAAVTASSIVFLSAVG